MDKRGLFSSAITLGMFEKSKIRQFSGQYRQTYRLLMIQFFTSSFFNHDEQFFYAYKHLNKMHAGAYLKRVGEIKIEDLLDIDLNTSMYLTAICGLKLVDGEKTIGEDYIIQENLLMAADFFNKYKDNINQADPTTLYRYSEIEGFWDLSSHFTGIKLLLIIGSIYRNLFTKNLFLLFQNTLLT